MLKVSLFKAVLFGAFGIAALIGIFVFATHTANKTSTNEVGVVVIWGTLPKADIQTALGQLQQTDPNTFKSVTYIEKDSGTLSTDLTSAIATGNAPDLILDSQENLLALEKYLTPIPSTSLSPAAFTNAFIGGASIFAAADGYYGIPFLVDPLALFSNRSILASTGIAQPPFTWESLAGLVPRVSILTPSRQVVRALIGMGTYANVHNARGILSALFLQQSVPITGTSPSGLLSADLGATSGSGVAPGTSVVSFYTQFADPSKISYTWNASLNDSRQMFTVGDVALYLGYISETRYFKTANPNLDFVVSTLPQPQNATLRSTYGRIYAFMIPRGAQNVNGAYAVASQLANGPAQKIMAESTGLAPASLSELSHAPASVTGSVAYAEALYTKAWLSPSARQTDTVFSAMIGNVISGRLTLDTALDTAERALSALLQ